MEKLSINFWKGLKKFCEKGDYERLINNNQKQKQTQTRTRTRMTRVILEQQGSTASQGRRRRRFWRVKLNTKTRILGRVGSSKKWITRVRDAYVNMMNKISNTGLIGAEYGCGGPVVGPGNVFGGNRIKEYDEKMIQQVYKNFIAAQGQWVHS